MCFYTLFEIRFTGKSSNLHLWNPSNPLSCFTTLLICYIGIAWMGWIIYMIWYQEQARRETIGRLLIAWWLFGAWASATIDLWAHFLSFAWSKLRLCSANHRAGYFSNLACVWLSTVWAYPEQETENRPRSSGPGHRWTFTWEAPLLYLTLQRFISKLSFINRDYPRLGHG